MPNDSVLTEFKILLGKNRNNWTVKENHVLESVKLIYLLQHFLNA